VHSEGPNLVQKSAKSKRNHTYLGLLKEKGVKGDKLFRMYCNKKKVKRLYARQKERGRLLQFYNDPELREGERMKRSTRKTVNSS